MQIIVWNRPKLFRKLERPIFVVGCCNSGTTVLWRALLEHPELSGPETEGQDLKDLPPCMRHHLGKQTFRMFAHPRFNDIYHLTESDYDQKAAERIASVYLEHCVPGTRFCEKSPANSMRTRFLQSIFPDATFVIIVRDGIAVAEGIRRKRWYDPERPHMAGLKTNIADAAEQWRNANRILLQDRPYLSRSILVTYERLVNKTEETLVSTLKWCTCDGAFLPQPDFQTDLNCRQIARLAPEEKEITIRIESDFLDSLGYKPQCKENPRTRPKWDPRKRFQTLAVSAFLGDPLKASTGNAFP